MLFYYPVVHAIWNFHPFILYLLIIATIANIWFAQIKVQSNPLQWLRLWSFASVAGIVCDPAISHVWSRGAHITVFMYAAMNSWVLSGCLEDWSYCTSSCGNKTKWHWWCCHRWDGGYLCLWMVPLIVLQALEECQQHPSLLVCHRSRNPSNHKNHRNDRTITSATPQQPQLAKSQQPQMKAMATPCKQLPNQTAASSLAMSTASRQQQPAKNPATVKQIPC